jgi:hypothetical protein
MKIKYKHLDKSGVNKKLEKNCEHRNTDEIDGKSYIQNINNKKIFFRNK